MPKKSPQTGEILQHIARIISNCSWRGRVALFLVNENIIMDYLSTFDMPQHIDIARINLFLRYWLGMEICILGYKRDVEGAFRRKYVAPSSFGTLMTEVNGHTILEVTFILGSVNAHAVYNYSGKAIHQAHNDTEWVLEWAVGQLKKGDKIPCTSITYCNNGVLQCPDIQKGLEFGIPSVFLVPR